jgi:nitrate/nitrite-specific signal transduction histidine kinase
LLRGDAGLNLTGDNSKAVVQSFAELEPEFEAMSASFESLSQDAQRMTPAAVGAIVVDILAHEARYVQLMDQTVAMYEGEARQRVTTLRVVEIVVMPLALLVLMLEARFIFRPAASAAPDDPGAAGIQR